MRAYLSYSLNDEQQYVVTVLAQILREKGYVLTAGSGRAGLRILPGTSGDPLLGCNLFIGVVTRSGVESDRVIGEYNKAISYSIPALLLVDEGVAYASGIQASSNIVLFNHANPSGAMSLVRGRVKDARIQPPSDDTSAWVLGGLAVLALIALLSSKK